jgi:hypothetical protein
MMLVKTALQAPTQVRLAQPAISHASTARLVHIRPIQRHLISPFVFGVRKVNILQRQVPRISITACNARLARTRSSGLRHQRRRAASVGLAHIRPGLEQHPMPLAKIVPKAPTQ